MKKFRLTFLLLILFSACAVNNDEDLILAEEEIQISNREDYVVENIVPSASLEDSSCDCSQSEVFDPLFDGTACCIQRIGELSLTEPIQYRYFTNLESPSVEWEVFSGEIEIVSGQDASIVFIRLKDGFEGGEIRGLGTSSPLGLQCSTKVIIEKLEE